MQYRFAVVPLILQVISCLGKDNESLADLKVQIALEVSLKSVIFQISLLLWFCIFRNSKQAQKNRNKKKKKKEHKLEYLLSDSNSLQMRLQFILKR